MKRLVPLIFPVFIAISPFCRGQDEAAVSRPQETNLASPDTRLQASVAEHALEIRDSATGKAIFHGPPDAGSDQSHYRADAMLWSPNSRILAIASGNNEACVTRVFIRDGEAFSEIPFPIQKGAASPTSIVPVSWSPNNILTVRSTPANGAVEDSAKERTFQVVFDLKKKKAKIAGKKKSESVREMEPGTNELAISEIPAPQPGTATSLLIAISSPAGEDVAATQIILPGETADATRIPLRGNGAAYLLNADRTAVAYCNLRKESKETEINIVSLAPENGLRIYSGVQRAASEAILRSKLGRQLFPKGGLQLDRIDSLTTKTAVLSASVTPESFGGATKILVCTIRLRPDATTEVLEWHLSER